MEERSDLFDGEDLLPSEPFAREIAENVSAEELVRIMGPMGFETVVRRSGKLRKRRDDIVELGLGENLVARGNHDSHDGFEAGFLRLLAYEFLALAGVFFVMSSFFIVGFEENRKHRSKNARHDVLVVSAYVVSLFERLTLPIVRNGPNENLHDRRFVFGELSKNAGNRIDRIGFEFLVGPDGEERVFVENHLGTCRDLARPEDVGLRNLFDDSVGIKARNLLFDKDSRFSGNRHVKEDFAVLGDVFERYAVRAEELLANAAFGKAAQRREELLHDAGPLLEVAHGFFPLVGVAVLTRKHDFEKRRFEGAVERYFPVRPKNRVREEGERGGRCEYQGFLGHRGRLVRICVHSTAMGRKIQK